MLTYFSTMHIDCGRSWADHDNAVRTNAGPFGCPRCSSCRCPLAEQATDQYPAEGCDDRWCHCHAWAVDP